MDISKLDPNLVITLVTLIGTGITWIVNKARGKKTEDIGDALWHALEGKVIALAEANVDMVASEIRSRLLVAANEALARMGIKANAITDAIMLKLVERGVTEVRKKLAARKAAMRLEAGILATATQAAAVTDAFTPPTAPTVPPLGLDIEYVKPEPTP